MHSELKTKLESELVETERALGPLPEGISLKTITRDCDNLHFVALLVILEFCREKKDYECLKFFWNRRQTEIGQEVAEDLWILRLYDGMDSRWIDIGRPVSRKEADELWKKYTKNGTEKTCYADIDYYKTFPANTRMLYS